MRLKRTAEDIIAIGQELQAAKEQLADPDGGMFLAWINAEFDMSKSTAYQFINVAKRFGGSLPNFGKLAPSVLYLLAAPSTPDPVIEQVQFGEVAATTAVKASPRHRSMAWERIWR